jgi:hypothetical protein
VRKLKAGDDKEILRTLCQARDTLQKACSLITGLDLVRMVMTDKNAFDTASPSSSSMKTPLSDAFHEAAQEVDGLIWDLFPDED